MNVRNNLKPRVKQKQNKSKDIDYFCKQVNINTKNQRKNKLETINENPNLILHLPENTAKKIEISQSNLQYTDKQVAPYDLKINIFDFKTNRLLRSKTYGKTF